MIFLGSVHVSAKNPNIRVAENCLTKRKQFELDMSCPGKYLEVFGEIFDEERKLE